MVYGIRRPAECGRRLTSFNNFAAGLDIQPRGDERNVREVEDLRAVRERESPELGRRAEDVDEALAVARADLGPIGNADKVVMTVKAEPVVDLLAWSNDERLDKVAGLVPGHTRNSAMTCGRKAGDTRSRTIQTMTRSPGAISRAEDHIAGCGVSLLDVK